ncbi:hypothetical protein [Nocardia sp. NPDC004722]
MIRRFHWYKALLALLSVLAACLTLVLGVSPAAYAAPDDEVAACQTQQDALDQVRAKIAHHNDEPHTFDIPEQQAAADAYDAEADELTTEDQADIQALEKCESATDQLAAGQQPKKLTRNQIVTVQAGKDKVPAGYVPPDVTKQYLSGAPVRVTDELRPLYKALGEFSPPKNVGKWVLQGQPKPKIGDPDPSQHPSGGGTIQPNPQHPSNPYVALDHIVPRSRLLYLPGFLQLSAENMLLMVNAPLNFQWLPVRVNGAKLSKNAMAILNVDPQWRQAQQDLQAKIEPQLIAIIAQLLANQGGK